MPRPLKSKIEVPPAKEPFTVVRDTREQKGQGWIFEESSHCKGTVIKTLKTGDYSLTGLEEIFVIERKRNTAEFAKNILEVRFENELKRLDSFAHPFLLCEFTLNDIFYWPLNSGLPPSIIKKVKINKYFILKKLIEYELKYKTKIIFAGSHGKELAMGFFKQVDELYATR